MHHFRGKGKHNVRITVSLSRVVLSGVSVVSPVLDVEV